MSEEKDTEAKHTSRKFLVWVVWLVLTIGVVIFCAVAMVVSSGLSESLSVLIEKALGWFFAISMMYLGVNVGQKAALALSDALGKEKEE